MQSRSLDSMVHVGREEDEPASVTHNDRQSDRAATASVDDSGKVRLGGAYRLPSLSKADR
jgi:hypothetical protein